MRKAAADARDSTENLSRQDFLGDTRTQHAVLINLFIIGEVAAVILAKHADFADAHPEIEWQNIRALRNRIGHAYFSINLDVVWDTVLIELPKLMSDLAAIS